ncbi:MAG: N-6 DNA methylase [bacterium]
MGKIAQQQLETHLWAAADILRGSIDSGDYKNYIFGFLFLKRVSDVFEEVAQGSGTPVRGQGIEEYSEEAGNLAWLDLRKDQLFVPTEARWSEIGRVESHLGDLLNQACSALEESNGLKLRGVLTGIDFNDERKLGDLQSRDALLFRLIQHFSKIRLGNQDLSEPDLLGRAYEYLIERFADDAGKKGGEFYTPRGLVRALVGLLDPREGMSICDPTCGSGGMLIECAHYVQGAVGNPAALSLFGQEKNLGTWAICRMNMFLHGLPEARIEKGDTIRSPRLVENGRLMLFDRVIANPPFSLDNWGWEAVGDDEYHRFPYGIPPRNKGDLAFVQHMVASTRVRGMVGVVLPPGVLFREGAEGKIRRGLVEDDLIEAVIGLPPNLFYHTSIPAVVLIFRRGKPKERQGKVLFIQAAHGFEAGRNQNRLSSHDIDHIVRVYQAFGDEDGYARVAGLDEVRENNHNLNVSRYVGLIEDEEQPDAGKELKRLRQLMEERTEAEAVMNVFLKELGLE